MSLDVFSSLVSIPSCNKVIDLGVTLLKRGLQVVY